MNALKKSFAPNARHGSPKNIGSNSCFSEAIISKTAPMRANANPQITMTFRKPALVMDVELSKLEWQFAK
jgi:hypothetical protein